jgi:hypothetical protein
MPPIELEPVQLTETTVDEEMSVDELVTLLTDIQTMVKEMHDVFVQLKPMVEAMSGGMGGMPPGLLPPGINLPGRSRR